MTREAKVGVMMVALVVGVFGFLLYKRMHRPPEILAEQVAQNDSQGLADQREIGLDRDRNRSQPMEQEPKSERFRESRGNRREIELASETVDTFGDDVGETVNPPANDRRNREKPSLPVDISSADDDFGLFQQTRESRVPPARVRSPDPVDDAFDPPVQQQMQPPRTIPVDGVSTTSDPFADNESTSSVQPVQFDAPARRERSVSTPDDAPFGGSSRELRSAPDHAETIAQLEEPRRTRESESVFEAAPRGTRRAAQTAVFEDRAASDAEFDRIGAGDAQTYVVQPNDNLWSISRKRYGAGRYYKALGLHNRQTIPDPKMMKPGIVISTPDVSLLEQKYAESIPKLAPVDATPTVTTTQSRRTTETEPAGYFVAADGVPMYRVGEQDTLTGIAKSHLGRTTRWVQILEMNRNVLRDGNDLKIGTVLRLPADASRVQVVGTARDYR